MHVASSSLPHHSLKYMQPFQRTVKWMNGKRCAWWEGDDKGSMLMSYYFHKYPNFVLPFSFRGCGGFSYRFYSLCFHSFSLSLLFHLSLFFPIFFSFFSIFSFFFYLFLFIASFFSLPWCLLIELKKKSRWNWIYYPTFGGDMVSAVHFHVILKDASHLHIWHAMLFKSDKIDRTTWNQFNTHINE